MRFLSWAEDSFLGNWKSNLIENCQIHCTKFSSCTSSCVKICYICPAADHTASFNQWQPTQPNLDQFSKHTILIENLKCPAYLSRSYKSWELLDILYFPTFANRPVSQVSFLPPHGHSTFSVSGQSATSTRIGTHNFYYSLS